MPLPAEGSAWPPPQWAPAFSRYRLDNALWLNDTDTLAALLHGETGERIGDTTVGAMFRGSRLGVSRTRRWWWGSSPAVGERRTTLPVPIGASLADLSAAQLMSEAPRFRLTDADGRTLRGAAQERVDMIANSDDAHMTLIEGAQLAAALGGAVMKANWDLTDPDRSAVWYDVVGADCAIPTYSSTGRLLEVLLFTRYSDPNDASGQRVMRHFELHTPGFITHALYQGTAISVGRVVNLDRLEQTAPILTIPNTVTNGITVSVPTGITRLTAAYWRNRPSRLWRTDGVLSNLGRSDFELIEPLLDAYSEAWSSMMRDVRLGKARLLVPLGMLEFSELGKGGTFDSEREMYTEIGGLNPEAGTDSIKDHQAAIRWQEHMRVLAGIKTEILDGAGWSLSSFGQPAGLDAQGGVTATEIVDRTTKSERTRDEKALYFKQPAQVFMRALLELDALAYPRAGSEPVDRLAIEFPDVSQVDPEKQARTFLDLSTANAISIEQTVRERRPNWDEDDVMREVNRIIADLSRRTGGSSPDPALIGRREQINLTDPADPDGTLTPPDPADEEA